jgi:hypothetical protein
MLDGGSGLMINCAEICQTSANFMLSGLDLHHLKVAVKWRRKLPPAVAIQKIVAGVVLTCLWGGVGWIIARERRISRELVENEAMQRPGPRANLLVLIGAVVAAFTGLLLYVIFG